MEQVAEALALESTARLWLPEGMSPILSHAVGQISFLGMSGID